MAERKLADVLMERNPLAGPEEERGFLLPFSRNPATNALGPAVPGIIYEPYQSLARLLQGSYVPRSGDAGPIQDVTNVAGSVMMPGLGLNALGMMQRGALGTSGGRLPKIKLLQENEAGEWVDWVPPDKSRFDGPNKVRDYDPSSLTFRETMQNNTQSVADAFPSAADMPPLVLKRGPDGNEIIDGHNRAAVAIERGERSVPGVTISNRVYSYLRERGFDDMEIANFVLEARRQEDAASMLRGQFPGSNLGRDEDAIWEALKRRR